MQRLIKLYKNVEDNFSSLKTEKDLLLLLLIRKIRYDAKIEIIQERGR